MLHEIFYWLLNMSILGGFVSIIVILLRRIGMLTFISCISFGILLLAIIAVLLTNAQV